MKFISFNQKELKDVPEFLNEALDEAQQTGEKYLMFIDSNISEQALDTSELMDRYTELMERNELPYAFYPYYRHFNKVLPGICNKHNPACSIKVKGEFDVDVVKQPRIPVC